MRVRIIIAILAFGAVLAATADSAYAQEGPQRGVNLQQMLQMANQYHQKGEYDKAISIYSQVAALVKRMSRQIPEEQAKEVYKLCYYNIACARSLQDKTDEAIKYLKLAVKHGWNDTEHMKTDGDLDNIRELDEYKKVVKMIEDGETPDVEDPKTPQPRMPAPARPDKKKPEKKEEKKEPEEDKEPPDEWR